jgi:hypothetical protein
MTIVMPKKLIEDNERRIDLRRERCFAAVPTKNVPKRYPMKKMLLIIERRYLLWLENIFSRMGMRMLKEIISEPSAKKMREEVITERR